MTRDEPQPTSDPGDDGAPAEAGAPTDGGAAATGDAGGDAGSEPADDHSLAQRAASIVPPPPPRRTGVFVDERDLREHVGALLRSILGSYEVDAFGNFTFTHEGARIFLTIGTSPVGPQVGVFSITNLDVDLDLSLATFLLTTNHMLGFGAFSYDPGNRAVWLRHTLLGTTLDLPELRSCVAAVASTAATLDDDIRDRFGGRTFHEAPADVQRNMGPPETGSSGYL